MARNLIPNFQWQSNGIKYELCLFISLEKKYHRHRFLSEISLNNVQFSKVQFTISDINSESKKEYEYVYQLQLEGNFVSTDLVKFKVEYSVAADPGTFYTNNFNFISWQLIFNVYLTKTRNKMFRVSLFNSYTLTLTINYLCRLLNIL